MSAACLWTPVNPQDDDRIWNTECGQTHQFTDGGPRENEHTFCPYCGRGIVLESDGDKEGCKLALLYGVVKAARHVMSGIQTIETEHENILMTALDDALHALDEFLAGVTP